jgi:hypothetical protein
MRPTTPDEHTASTIDTDSSPHSPLPHKIPAAQTIGARSNAALQNITNRANLPVRPPLNRFKASTFCTISGKPVYSGLAQTNTEKSTPVFKTSSSHQFQVTARTHFKHRLISRWQIAKNLMPCRWMIKKTSIRQKPASMNFLPWPRLLLFQSRRTT